MRNSYRTSHIYVSPLSVRSYTTSSQRATPYLIESNLRLRASLRRLSDVNALNTSWMNDAIRGGSAKFCAVTEFTASRGCSQLRPQDALSCLNDTYKLIHHADNALEVVVRDELELADVLTLHCLVS